MYRLGSFVEHFNGNSHVKVVIFQSDITKFDQKKYFRLFLYYTGLCARYSVKEAINSFFQKSALRNIMKMHYA